MYVNTKYNFPKQWIKNKRNTNSTIYSLHSIFPKHYCEHLLPSIIDSKLIFTGLYPNVYDQFTCARPHVRVQHQLIKVKQKQLSSRHTSMSPMYNKPTLTTFIITSVKNFWYYIQIKYSMQNHLNMFNKVDITCDQRKIIVSIPVV